MWKHARPTSSLRLQSCVIIYYLVLINQLFELTADVFVLKVWSTPFAHAPALRRSQQYIGVFGSPENKAAGGDAPEAISMTAPVVVGSPSPDPGEEARGSNACHQQCLLRIVWVWRGMALLAGFLSPVHLFVCFDLS